MMVGLRISTESLCLICTGVILSMSICGDRAIAQAPSAKARVQKLAPQPLLAPTQRASPPGTASLIVAESFINQFVETTKTEQGPVRDFVLGADVFGEQSTTAQTTIDLLPFASAARLQLRLSGTTTNQTTNFTPVAAVQSRGQYNFLLTKQIQFDGRIISTWSPAAYLTPHLENLNASTRLTTLPILGPLANQRALNVANRRRPAAEQIATQKVARSIADRFNQDVDRELVALNRTLQTDLPAWLQKLQLPDLNVASSSTDRDLIVTLAHGEKSVFGVGKQVQGLHPENDIGARVQEEFLNALIEKLPLAGLQLSDTKLKSLLAGQAASRHVSVTPQRVSFELTGSQPLRVRLRNGVMDLHVRHVVHPVLGPSLGEYEFVWQVTPILDELNLRLQFELVDVVAVKSTGAALTVQDVHEQLQFKLTPVTLPKTSSIPAGVIPKPLSVKLQEVVMSNGELAVEFSANALAN